MPFANRNSTVKTTERAASSVDPICPTNAWVITVTPNVENLVKIAGPATTHIFLLSIHSLFLNDDSSSPPLLTFKSFSLTSPSMLEYCCGRRRVPLPFEKHVSYMICSFNFWYSRQVLVWWHLILSVVVFFMPINV